MTTKTKTSGTTWIGVALDRSGSMNWLAEETIGGFNGWLKDTKKAYKGQKCRITVMLFDDQTEFWVEDVPITALDKLTKETYFVRGFTALRDAFGRTLVSLMAAKQKDDKMICLVTTDGLENASREWSLSELKKLIAKFEKAGGEIVYLGAGQDAVMVGGEMGLRQAQTISTQRGHVGTRATWGAASAGLRSSAGGQSVNLGATQSGYDALVQEEKKKEQ